MDTVENPPASNAGPRSRLTALILAFNVILLGVPPLQDVRPRLTPSGGVSVSLANGTLSPMIDLSLRYPGGKLDLPRLNVGERVGHPIADVKEFDATLTFKDEDGHAFKETVHIRPMDEFLILIEVRPVLEPSAVKTAEGAELKVVRASASKVRVTTAYQAPGHLQLGGRTRRCPPPQSSAVATSPAAGRDPTISRRTLSINGDARDDSQTRRAPRPAGVADGLGRRRRG